MKLKYIKIINYNQVELILGAQGWFNMYKQCMNNDTTLKCKNDMILSTDEEKAFDNI